MASQDHEKALDGLLRRTLARDPAAKGDCPDAELLAAYYERSLGADEAARYELHFSQCTRCREQLVAMARAEAEQAAEVEIPAEPVLVAARAMDARPAAVLVGADGPERADSRPKVEARRRPELLELRWLAPIAAVIIFAVVVYVRFMPRQTNLAINSRPAMSQQPPAPEPQVEAEPARPAAATGSNKEKKASGNSSAARPRPQSPSTSAPMRAHTTTATVARGGTTSRNTAAASPAARAEAQSASAEFAQKSAEPEPEPAAPPPELKASMPSASIATDSAETVKPPEPAPHTQSSGEVRSFGLAGRRAAGNAAGARTNSAPGAKATTQRAAQILIRTPDSNVLYRIPVRGYIERSEDAGATWQGQHVNATAEFTAGSAPTANVCWLVGRAGVIFLTDDGTNWKSISSPTASDLLSVSAKDALSATVTARDGQQWSTDDGGDTWSPAK